MTEDLREQADELERQVQALRTLASDVRLPALAAELAELSEHARRARARVLRAAAESGQIRIDIAAKRAARAGRVRELAASGAPVAAIAAHASMSVAAVRSCLADEHVEGGDTDGIVGEMVEAAPEPEPEPEPF